MNRDPEAWARLGRLVRSERERSGKTRAELAEMAEVSARAVQVLESGRVPKGRWPHTVPTIERALGWAAGSAEAILEGGGPVRESAGLDAERQLLELFRSLSTEQQSHALEMLSALSATRYNFFDLPWMASPGHGSASFGVADVVAGRNIPTSQPPPPRGLIGSSSELDDWLARSLESLRSRASEDIASMRGIAPPDHHPE